MTTTKLRAFGRKRHPKDCDATLQTDFQSKTAAEGKGLLYCLRCGWIEPHPFYRDDYDGNCSACGEAGSFRAIHTDRSIS